MKYVCEDCGKECEDNYPFVNDMNRRTHCNECVDKLWKEYNDRKKLASDCRKKNTGRLDRSAKYYQ